MIYMFYIICGAIKNREKITPHLSDAMIRNAMKHPVRFREIVIFKKYKFTNFIFWFIGSLPASLSVFALIVFYILVFLLNIKDGIDHYKKQFGRKNK